jgi:ATP-binding cassette subfamily B protein
MGHTKQILTLFLTSALRYKLLVAAIILWLPVLIVLHQIIPPVIASGILDRLAEGDFTNDVWSSFGSTLLAYAALIIFTSTIGWRVIIYLIWTLERKVTIDLLRKAFDHFMALDMDFHNNSFGGSLVSRTNKMVGSYIRLADTFVFEFVGLVTIFAATGFVLWDAAPLFVIAFYVFSLIYILLAIIITRFIRKLSIIEANKQNKVTGYLADMITNVLAVKSYANRNYENTRYEEATADLGESTRKLMWASIHRENIFGFTTATITSMALIMATITVVVYDANIGTVFLIYTLTTNMTVRLWDFSQRVLRNINKSLGDAEEAVATLFTEPKIKDPLKPISIPSGGHITLQNMTFSHDDNQLFSNLNLDIKPGEKIGLVGHSGSGKSTLTKLLLRFVDIQSGSIQLNGVDIREAKQDDVRSMIAYVPQEPLLFHRSLRENIAYGKHDASEKEIISAAKKSNAHEFIKTLESGYDTLVGERGVKLSGGQKQRIAIARAMLKDAPILLLDEATSALDSESEQLIQEALWKLMKGKTAVVIAHRLSTIQKMDRIIVLEQGKIVEDGTHKELLHKKGQYAKLWEHQSGGFLSD